MKRAILALVLGAGPAVLALGGTAGAATHGHGTTQDLTIDRTVTLASGGLAFTATGTYNCPVGNDFVVNVFITQRSGQLVSTGSGGIQGQPACTGAPETWQVQGFVQPFTPNANPPLHNGKASALVNAESFGTQPNTSTQISATVNLGS
jgi:hypothetical protein